MWSPLEQFLVAYVFKQPVLNSFVLLITNFTVFVFYYLVLILFLFFFISKLTGLFLKNFLTYVNYIYSGLIGLVSSDFSLSNLYFIWFLSLSICLTFFNVFGIFPFSFTVTTHLFVSLSISFFFFAWINLVFFLRYFIEWGVIFSPTGAPFLILPLIVPIEIISYFSRILSLSIRLFANMMSGHTLLVILGGFLFSLFSLNLFYVLPISLLHLIILMEVGVAFLQVYVFIVLTRLYINDVTSDSAH